MNKPTATTFLGTYICILDDSERSQKEALQILEKSIDDLKEKHTHENVNSFCKFGEPVFVKRPSFSVGFMRGISSVGFKIEATGRAFYINRNFPPTKPTRLIKRHKNKNAVPKNKRGKWIIEKCDCRSVDGLQ